MQNQSLIELFTHLVSIDSPSGKEGSMAEFVFAYLEGCGLTPQKDSENMVYCRVGSGVTPLLFCVHLDTVESGGEIKIIEKDGEVRSDGKTTLAGDNKVAISTLLFTIRKLVEEKKPLNLELLFTVREETDSGIQKFNYQQLQSRVGFVFDDGDGDLGMVITKAPTIQDFKIELIGKPAHASRPELGINSLDLLLQAAPYLKLGRPDEYSTFNIGLIRGGDATNTVPAYLKLEGDLRSTKVENFNALKKHVTEMFTKSAEKIRAQAHIKWIPYSYGYELNTETDAFQRLTSLYKTLGFSLKHIETNGGSDAGFLNHIGIETFCLGDGLVDAHTINEHVKIRDFIELQKIIEAIMTKFNYTDTTNA